MMDDGKAGDHKKVEKWKIKASQDFMGLSLAFCSMSKLLDRSR